VADLIAAKFGVPYHPSAVWHILRKMGWRCQKPQRRARERNETAIAVWRQQEWLRMKKRPKNRPQSCVAR
jgi:putative transposase